MNPSCIQQTAAAILKIWSIVITSLKLLIWCCFFFIILLKYHLSLLLHDWRVLSEGCCRKVILWERTNLREKWGFVEREEEQKSTCKSWLRQKIDLQKFAVMNRWSICHCCFCCQGKLCTEEAWSTSEVFKLCLVELVERTHRCWRTKVKRL